MVKIATRAPILYLDVRNQYNMLRAAGSLLFAIGVVVWSFATGETAGLVVAVPAMAIFIDALYRRNHGTTAFPAELLAATANSG